MKSEQAVQRFVDASIAPATKLSYTADMRAFTRWGGRVPATAQTVAAYLAESAESAESAETLAVATLQHRLIAVHRAHLEAGCASPVMDPLVKRTMQGIRRTKGTAQRRVTHWSR